MRANMTGEIAGEKELYSTVHPDVKGPKQVGPSTEGGVVRSSMQGAPRGYAPRHLSAEERGFVVVGEADYEDEPSTCG